jgi:hypothetical protein
MGPKGRVSEERQGRSKGTLFLVLAFLVFLGNFKFLCFDHENTQWLVRQYSAS